MQTKHLVHSLDLLSIEQQKQGTYVAMMVPAPWVDEGLTLTACTPVISLETLSFVLALASSSTDHVFIYLYLFIYLIRGPDVFILITLG